MPQITPLISLQVPAPETTTLSFCKPTARDLAKWLDALPKANTGEYSRLLFNALIELNKLNAAPELRLQLLELLRPETLLLIRQLEKHHLLNAVILDARASKVANLCQALYYHLNTGYKRLALDLQHKKSPMLAQVLQRALFGLYSRLALAHLTYRAVPSGLWHEMHQLLALSMQHGLNNQKISDRLLLSVASQTPEQAYSCALLLGCARANQLRQPDIQLLVEALPDWSRLVQLQNIHAANSLFAVTLASDQPPRYKTLLNLSEHSAVLGFNTNALISALQSQDGKTPDSDERIKLSGLSNHLIEHLTQAWGDIAKRDFKRSPSQDQLLLTLGMPAVHFHLAGQQSFEDTLGSAPEVPLPIVCEEEQELSDAWSMAVNAARDAAGSHNHESIDYSTSLETPQDNFLTPSFTELYPVQLVNIVNQSPSGYCLEWQQSQPGNLQTGDILALRNNPEAQWAVGTIRWIQQNNQDVQIGVEMLAAQAEPCGARLIRSGKPASSYLRALRIAGTDTATTPAQLITPTIPFRQNNSVQINLHGENIQAVLTRLVRQTASCNLFEYETAAPLLEPVPLAPLAATEPIVQDSSEHDEFKSLWSLL